MKSWTDLLMAKDTRLVEVMLVRRTDLQLMDAADQGDKRAEAHLRKFPPRGAYVRVLPENLEVLP